jgi:peptidoglycan/LPS O-acetylase OafA/YrhL
LGPVKASIYYFSRGYPSAGFFVLFKELMLNAISLQTAPLATIDQFNHWHLWYLSLLFYFFLVFALLYKIKGFVTEKPPFKLGRVATNREILLVLFLAAMIASLLILFARFFISGGQVRDPWMTVLSIVQFRTSNLILHFICFWVGVYAYQRNWFSNDKPPGSIMLWAATSLVLMVGMIGTLVQKMVTLSVFVQNLACFSIILLLLSFTKKYMNNDSKMTKSLADNSYSIYLIHMVFIVSLQLLLFKLWAGYIFIKFIIVGVSTIMISYLISRFALTPHPRLSVAGLCSVFVLLCFVI